MLWTSRKVRALGCQTRPCILSAHCACNPGLSTSTNISLSFGCNYLTTLEHGASTTNVQSVAMRAWLTAVSG